MHIISLPFYECPTVRQQNVDSVKIAEDEHKQHPILFTKNKKRKKYNKTYLHPSFGIFYDIDQIICVACCEIIN